MKSSSFIIIVSLLVCALYAQEKTTPAGEGVIRRAGEPDCFQITDDNKPMAVAVQKARKTLNKFISVLRSPKSSQTRFAIKKPFIEGDKVEHIWIANVTFDGRVFHGTVDNEPMELKAAHLGDKVSVAPDEISDWMYVQDGR